MNIKTEAGSALNSVELNCWNCEYCNKVYASKSNRDSHIKLLHMPVQCPTCGGVFSSISLFRKHHNSEHSNGAKKPTTPYHGIGPISIDLTETPSSWRRERIGDAQVENEFFKNISKLANWKFCQSFTFTFVFFGINTQIYKKWIATTSN